MSTETKTNLKLDVLTPEGKKDGKVELPAEIFDVQTNVPLIHQVVVAQLAAARQGTHKAKSRGEVRGGGRKPYKQKGTGRARQGSTRAPQFAGGGVVAASESAAPPANRSGAWAEIHALFLALLQAADDGICDCLDPMGEAGVCGEHYQGQGDQLQGQFDRLCAAAGRLLGDSVR